MPAAHVEAARDQEVDIRLFELQSRPSSSRPLDERVFQLELANEADAIGEAVREQQDEAMEVERGIGQLGVVVVKVHVPREIRACSLTPAGCVG
jgi:hypothetical protein